MIIVFQLSKLEPQLVMWLRTLVLYFSLSLSSFPPTLSIIFSPPISLSLSVSLSLSSLLLYLPFLSQG